METHKISTIVQNEEIFYFLLWHKSPKLALIMKYFVYKYTIHMNVELITLQKADVSGGVTEAAAAALACATYTHTCIVLVLQMMIPRRPNRIENNSRCQITRNI